MSEGQGYIDGMSEADRLNKKVLELEAEVAAQKLRADRAVEHSTEMESRAWAADSTLTSLLPNLSKMEMQLNAAREERDEVRAELKEWQRGHPASLCSAHQVLELNCRMCNSALIRLDEALAACAEMREVLTVCGTEKLVSVDGSRIDSALSVEAGKGWMSPTWHQNIRKVLLKAAEALVTLKHRDVDGHACWCLLWPDEAPHCEVELRNDSAEHCVKAQDALAALKLYLEGSSFAQ